ncbi:hypothetical protein LSH36_5g06002 [Paralvinella palmiformis]|uniref:Uncharacterized protein n=1 Tax=Paralvinella palmiformis TaxID=53620 RepID=A0AAD9KF82_9ANNE|nr:hypothetical protein LSH36_5g06002 [Paralvinella palmiformis]
MIRYIWQVLGIKSTCKVLLVETFHKHEYECNSNPAPLSNDAIYDEQVPIDDEHVLADDEHVLPDDEHVLPDDEHILEDTEHVPPDDEHVLADDEHVLPDDEHVLPDDEHILEDTEHVPPDDEHVLADDEHVLPDDEYVLPDDEHILEDTEHVPPDDEHVPPDRKTKRRPLSRTRRLGKTPPGRCSGDTPTSDRQLARLIPEVEIIGCQLSPGELLAGCVGHYVQAADAGPLSTRPQTPHAKQTENA